VATFSAVTRQHILKAIAEHDSRGADDFLGVYGFTPGGYPLVHEGRSYDSIAILGVAHRYATGRLASADEVGTIATALLRKRGFEVTEPLSARRAAPAAPAPRRAPATRRAAPVVPERVDPVCPTCATVLPGTGICDYCS
jgi:hypothetical protein